MRTRKILNLVAIFLGCVALMGTKCPPIPEIVEKTIELALTGSVTDEFTSLGEINVHHDVVSFDINEKLGLEDIIDDGGIDVSQLKKALIAGAQYRTIKKDPSDERRIVNGTVTVNGESLVTDFNVLVNSVDDWKTAKLNAEGVTLLNEVLDRIVRHLRDGDPLGNTTLTANVDGLSTPEGVATDFKWELKLIFTIIGTITVDSVDF